MYRKSSNLAFNQIVGHLPRNLFSWEQNNAIQLATYFKDKLQVLSIEYCKNELEPKVNLTKETSLSDSRCNILEARVIEIDTQLILTIITERNIQFHDLVSSRVLYTFIPDESSDDLESLTYSINYSFASGISKCHIANKWYILIGFYTGGVLLFTYGKQTNEVFYNIQYEGTVEGPYSHPITHLYSDGCYIITGDYFGNTVIWQPDKQLILTVSHRFEAFNGFPVTSVALCGQLAVSTYGSGHIRVHCLEKNVLLAEIHGHAGWINCMQVSNEHDDRSYTVATVSDDSMIRFWKVNKSSNRPIASICHHVLKNTLVVGLAFGDSLGKRAFVTGYDSALVTIYERE